VGRWGIEARTLGTLALSENNCPDNSETCPTSVTMTAIGVRRWLHDDYAWTAGLALASGGGARGGQTWDTHLGIGPSFGAVFKLAEWKHMVVSAMPRLDALFFMPSGSGDKTFILNLQGLVEAEVHLGFWGLPGVSVGTSAGLGVRYHNTAAEDEWYWQLDTLGPTSLWGLATNGFIRFYL
jgi:hypothetical protein